MTDLDLNGFTKPELYKECKELLGCQLLDAKRIVDVYIQNEIPSGTKEHRAEMYRSAWTEIKRQRSFEDKQRRDKAAQRRPARLVLHACDGRSASWVMDETVGEFLDYVGVYDDDPLREIEWQSVGSNMAYGILDVVHMKLDYAPEDFQELARLPQSKILALEIDGRPR